MLTKTGAKKRHSRKKRATHHKRIVATTKAGLPVRIIKKGVATIGGTRKHRRHSTSHRTLSGVADLLGVQNDLGRKATSALTDILFYGGGIVLGNIAEKQLTKLLKTDAADAPTWKKHLVPGGLILAGLGGAIFLPKGLVKSEALTGVLNKISAGVAISGTLSEIALLTGTNLLGLGSANDDAVRADYFKTAEETMRKIAEAQDFVPELPESTDGVAQSVRTAKTTQVLGETETNEIL